MKTKSISISKEYEKEYEYLLSQPNASRYVLELIRNDMKKAIEDKSIVDTVRSILESNQSIATQKHDKSNDKPLIINNDTIKTNASAFLKKPKSNS